MIKSVLQRALCARGSALDLDEVEFIKSFAENWQKNNVIELDKIFSGQVLYVENKHKKFDSKIGLIKFWCLNALTHWDGKVEVYDMIKVGSTLRVKFIYTFYTPIRSVFTTVGGQIFIRRASDGKISYFSQRSEKTETPVLFYNFEMISKIVFGPIVNIIQKSWRMIKFYGLPWINFIALAAIWITALILFVDKFFDLPYWVPKYIKDNVGTLSAYSFALSFVLTGLIKKVNDFKIKDIRFTAVNGEKDDINTIYKNIKSADSVTIISGDFSFIDKDNKLRDKLKDLAYKDKLTLVSYKPKNSVISEMQTRAFGREIAHILIENNKFVFDFPISSKMTMIRHGASRKMLIRYWKDDFGAPQQYIGVVRDTDNTRELTGLIEELIKVASREAVTAPA